ncbi:hypothetical protein FRB97_008559 [Tulasnella sp. 331]|nr:hypothetical protein FRB97_008559 [Tulasnella sp. 331]
MDKPKPKPVSNTIPHQRTSSPVGQVDIKVTSSGGPDSGQAIEAAEEGIQHIMSAEVAHYLQTAPGLVDYSITFEALVSRGYIDESILVRIEELILNLERMSVSQTSASSSPNMAPPFVPARPDSSDSTKSNGPMLKEEVIHVIYSRIPIIDPYPNAHRGKASTSKGKQRRSKEPALDDEARPPVDTPSVPCVPDGDSLRTIHSSPDLPLTPVVVSNKKGKRRAIYSDLQQAPSDPPRVPHLEPPSAPVSNLRLCGICWEECRDVSEFVQKAPSSSSNHYARFGLEMACSGGHYYCLTCIRKYIGGQLEAPMVSKGDTAAAIKCPECPRSDKDTRWMIGDDVAERVLGRDLIEGWHMRKLRASISEVSLLLPESDLLLPYRSA